ncbi:Efflux pump [Colletotrichum fructicola]|uniref:Major facilitator superfamily transporter n=1 Tax=Colletotrichum fructicola (strain Nara gc5) TaxID=1213859 RepID=L2G8T8_COLFN|nr:Efflux pump [Colletotrichum fructicola]KAE9580831.1 Efflux pump [Colletotrichum fructicola]KAF4422465.1 Efflux pump atB [Colletotrichum fructicola]KAF4892053.1 Efflux pump atB [Colletotrichum fructicola]KAF4935756.1 Efflux pump atB [Colletotrichum fructicola]
MPLSRKWLVVIIVCLGTVCVTCTSSIYTATYTQMNPEFGVPSLVATLGLSSFVLGIGLGPAVISPLSESYGRRPIYLTTWLLFIISTIPSAVARNIETIVITRFFSGFFGGTFLSVAGGSCGDMFPPHKIQTPMALVSLAPFAGPCTGPLLGGFINYYLNFRWTYYIMIIWAAVILVMIFFFAPETYHSVLLRAKAQRLRKETGDDRYHVPAEHSLPASKTRAVATSIVRPCQFLVFEPMCLCLNIFSAILLGILYLFFLAFPMVFRNQYDLNLWQGGLTFSGIIIGMCLAATTTQIWSKIRASLLESHGTSEPEFRLPPAMVGALLIPVGLFWTVLEFTGIFTFLVDAYKQYAASAMASNGLTRCTIAAAFPLFGVQMYEKLGYEWATSLLAFLTVAMMPFPWLFFKYGKKLRGRSRFAVRTK